MSNVSKVTKRARKAAAKARPRNGKVKTTKMAVATTKTTEVKSKARKARAITFEVTLKCNRRQFKPVNKRAKAFAELAGVQVMAVKHLKTIKALGFRVVENSNGELKAITL
jgi:hypothetical protein